MSKKTNIIGTGGLRVIIWRHVVFVQISARLFYHAMHGNITLRITPSTMEPCSTTKHRPPWSQAARQSQVDKACLTGLLWHWKDISQGRLHCGVQSAIQWISTCIPSTISLTITQTQVDGDLRHIYAHFVFCLKWLFQYFFKLDPSKT